MTDILGYDVNGEPLRAGDRVVPHGPITQPYVPSPPWTVKGRSVFGGDRILMQERDRDGDEWGRLASYCRKLKDDSPGKEHYKDQHKPCGQSFDELVKGFGRVEA